MSDLLVALGLVAVIEGVLYALAPATMKRMLLELQALPENTMRVGGLAVMAAGVLLVWIVRG